MRIVFCLVALTSCWHSLSSAPPTNRVSAIAMACPSLARDSGEDVPGYPKARRVPGVGMATTLNPGMNVFVDLYEVDAAVGDLEALYTRCIGQPVHADGEAQFTISASPDHTIAVWQHGRGSRVRVRCAGCY